MTFAAKVVMAELLARVADPSPQESKWARDALRRMWHHASLYNGYNEYLPVALDPEDFMAQALFGVTERKSQEHSTYAYLVGQVARGNSGQLAGELAFLREQMARKRAQFAMYFAAILHDRSGPDTLLHRLHQNPDLRHRLVEEIECGNGQPLLAQHLVRLAAKNHGISRSDYDMQRAAEELRLSAPAAFALFDRIIVRVFRDGTDVSKKRRANWLWDMQVCFYASRELRLVSVPILLVTDDADILYAAQASGQADAVCTLDEYRARIA
jgi:hypothetical protein